MDGAGITITPVFNPDRPPAALTATPTDAGNVALSWEDKSSGETQFNVYRGTIKGDFSQIGSTAANTTTYVDTTVDVGTYYYAVTFVNDIRESPKSNTASATVGDLVNVWTGDAWEEKVLHYYNGDEWIPADNIETQ
jgi:fibronectin type 3 domain-containing protein